MKDTALLQAAFRNTTKAFEHSPPTSPTSHSAISSTNTSFYSAPNSLADGIPLSYSAPSLPFLSSEHSISQGDSPRNSSVYSHSSSSPSILSSSSPPTLSHHSSAGPGSPSGLPRRSKGSALPAMPPRRTSDPNDKALKKKNLKGEDRKNKSGTRRRGSTSTYESGDETESAPCEPESGEGEEGSELQPKQTEKRRGISFTLRPTKTKWEDKEKGTKAKANSSSSGLGRKETHKIAGSSYAPQSEGATTATEPKKIGSKDEEELTRPSAPVGVRRRSKTANLASPSFSFEKSGDEEPIDDNNDNNKKKIKTKSRSRSRSSSSESLLEQDSSSGNNNNADPTVTAAAVHFKDTTETVETAK